MDHRQARMKRFLRDLPWWLASLAAHGALLVALAGVTLGTIAPPRKEIKIRTEFVEIVERTKPVTLREYVSPTPPQQAPRAGEDQQASAFLRDTPATVMDAGQLGAKIRSLLKAGKATQFDALAKAGADATLTIQKGRATTYEEVIDEFAIKIIEVVERRPLLIVFLFDESSSLMDDRKMINQKIDNVSKVLRTKVGEKELGRAHWAVVSFGTKAKIVQTATANLDQAKAAIADRIKEDTAGVENVLGGIEFVLANFKDPSRQLFITLVTDETGDDTKDDAKLDLLIAALKARKARLYVFGREANFSFPLAWAPYYGPTGDIIDWNWIQAGPESAFQEQFDHDWLFNPSARNLPSGFGMFAQCLLAAESDGLYFALSDVPSKYDDEKMKLYRPELVSRKVYLERTEQSPLRRALKLITTEWNKFRPTHWLTKLDDIKGQANGEMKKAADGQDFCHEALAALSRMRPTDRYSPKRWEANYDLVRAQLYKFLFLLRQYEEALIPCLRRSFPPPEKGKPFNGYLVTLDTTSSRLPGGRQAQKEKEDAEDALRLVMRKHPDTPWAVFAERELQYLKPMKVIPHFYVPTERVKM